MTGFSFTTVLFYTAYLCLAARAAPAVVTTLSPASVESTTDSGSAMTTVAPQEGPVVPAFQCSVLSTSDYHKSVTSLYTGFEQAKGYIDNQLTPGECSGPSGVRTPIFNRVGATEHAFSLEQGFAIFQAYSTIANLASQSDAVSETDRAKMQIVHELLNSLISNYYEVVSPDHCSCGSASSNNCITIPNLDFLVLDTYPDSCSPAAYVSINIVDEFNRLLRKFRRSPVFLENFDPSLKSCQQWKDDYLSPNSSAASAVTC